MSGAVGRDGNKDTEEGCAKMQRVLCCPVYYLF